MERKGEISRGATVAWLGVIMTVQCSLAAWAAWTHSPTLNEPGHLVAGLFGWETGQTSVYRVNPPLVRSIATLPVVMMKDMGWVDYELDMVGFVDAVGARPEFLMGDRFFERNGRRGLTILRISRLTLVLLLPLGTWLAFLWARDLSDISAGLVAASLWAFLPLLLGQSSLIVPDAMAMIAGGWALLAIWKIRVEQPMSLVWAGVAVAVAIGCKTTHLVLLPIGLIWTIALHRKSADRSWKKVTQNLAIPILLIPLLLNVFYGFNGVGLRLDEFEFCSDTLTGTDDGTDGRRDNRFRGTLVGRLPIPLPEDLIVGIDLQKKDFENYGVPSYLNGQFHNRGWWHYYLWVVLLKTPTTLLILMFALAVLWVTGRLPAGVDRRGVTFAIMSAVTYFAFVSSQSGISQHGRYVLPALAPLLVSIGCLGHGMALSRHRMRLWFVAPLVLAASVSSWMSSPNQLGYFNFLAGGTEGGPRYLLQSNVDWGQDLLRLERWSRESPLAVQQRIYLGFAELYNPFDLVGEPFEPWPKPLWAKPRPAATDAHSSEVPDGLYAITVNRLYGGPQSVCDWDGTYIDLNRAVLMQLQEFEPVARIGSSIEVFNHAQVRQALKMVPT